jgi:hypothetical protein
VCMPSPPAGLDRDLIFNFFWAFSVFECALKREGFAKARKNDSVEADWDCFSNFIRGQFATISEASFHEGVARLQRLAPRKQIFPNRKLDWEDQRRGDGKSHEAYTLRLLRTARNNLFHGGKYPYGDEIEIARNQDILRSALVVLGGVSRLHPGVKSWIDSYAA